MLLYCTICGCASTRGRGLQAAGATSNLQPVAGDNFAFTAQYQTQDWIGDLKARTIDLGAGIVSSVELWSAANASSSAPRENRPAAAPATLSGPLLPAWLLAQDRRMPSCQMDGREVPVGTTYCRQQRIWSCERSGWTNTGNPC